MGYLDNIYKDRIAALKQDSFTIPEYIPENTKINAKLDRLSNRRSQKNSEKYAPIETGAGIVRSVYDADTMTFNDDPTSTRIAGIDAYETTKNNNWLNRRDPRSGKYYNRERMDKQRIQLAGELGVSPEEVSNDDTGGIVDVGLRHMVTERIEVELTASHTEVFGYSVNAYEASGRLFILKRFSVGFGYSDSDDVESLFLNARMNI